MSPPPPGRLASADVLRRAIAAVCAWQNAFAFLCLVIGTYVDTILQAYIQAHPLAGVEAPPVPDLGYTALSAVHLPAWLTADIALGAVSATAFVRVLLEDDRVRLLRRYFLLQGIMFVMRGSTITVRLSYRRQGAGGPVVLNRFTAIVR